MAKAKIISNTLYQLGAKIISTFFTLLITVFITRLFGANTWGDYAVVISYITFFYVFTEFGVNSIAVKHFSQKDKIYSSDFLSFYLVRLLYTLFAILVAITGLIFLNYKYSIVQSILFLLLGLFFYSLGNAFNAVYQTKLLYKNLFYSTLVFTLVNLLTFLLIFNYYVPSKFYILFLPIILGEFARFVFSYFISKKYIITNLNLPNKQVFYKLLLLSFPLGLAIAFNTLMTQIDKIMLSAMVSSVYVGYYALSYKIFDLILVIPTFFMNVMFIYLSKSYKNLKDYSVLYTKTYLVLGLFSIFISVLFLIVSPTFIPLIWGNQMQNSVPSFLILLSFTVFFYLSSPVSWLFVVENKQKVLIVVYLVGFILNFLLNIFAIKYFNYIGAAVVTGITEVYVLLVLEVYRVKKLKARFLYKNCFMYIKDLYKDLVYYLAKK